ncbi:hypothetical protein BSKO_11743 [Bryopsis sp. KO-2023]|nr:hypothetical protein BSKO_11743 [Bryopsis sp. KO-2023]
MGGTYSGRASRTGGPSLGGPRSVGRGVHPTARAPQSRERTSRGRNGGTDAPGPRTCGRQGSSRFPRPWSPDRKAHVATSSSAAPSHSCVHGRSRNPNCDPNYTSATRTTPVFQFSRRAPCFSYRQQRTRGTDSRATQWSTQPTASRTTTRTCHSRARFCTNGRAEAEPKRPSGRRKATQRPEPSHQSYTAIRPRTSYGTTSRTTPWTQSTTGSWSCRIQFGNGPVCGPGFLCLSWTARPQLRIPRRSKKTAARRRRRGRW